VTTNTISSLRGIFIILHTKLQAWNHRLLLLLTVMVVPDTIGYLPFTVGLAWFPSTMVWTVWSIHVHVTTIRHCWTKVADRNTIWRRLQRSQQNRRTAAATHPKHYTSNHRSSNTNHIFTEYLTSINLKTTKFSHHLQNNNKDSPYKTRLWPQLLNLATWFWV